VIDPSLFDFLLGVGIGFIEEDESIARPKSITCPHCYFDFSPEEVIDKGSEYACPYCLKSLGGDLEDY
jgi:DNA-directed RNA polymerase subunit RPC12/RpoP